MPTPRRAPQRVPLAMPLREGAPDGPAGRPAPAAPPSPRRSQGALPGRPTPRATGPGRVFRRLILNIPGLDRGRLSAGGRFAVTLEVPGTRGTGGYGESVSSEYR